MKELEGLRDGEKCKECNLAKRMEGKVKVRSLQSLTEVRG